MTHPASPVPAHVRAVLFDFDGTLADSYDAITASVNHVRTTFGLPPMEEAVIRKLVGYGLAHLLHQVVPNVPTDEAVAEYRRHHSTVMVPLTRLLPGVSETLAELHRRGLRLAVCSNKTVAFTRTLTEALGIARYFDAVLGPEDAGKPKPDPAILRTALARLDVPASEAVYVGDMTVDIATARAAGVPVWVIPNGSDDAATLRAAGPDRLLDSISELPKMLAGQ